MADVVRVVAIDDHADLLGLYRIMFRGTEFDLVGASGDGRSGIDEVVAHRPDLILLDLSMPDMDGLEAMLDMRRAAPQAHVVVVSGFGRDRLGEVAEELGASHYIEKGAHPAEMLEQLRQVMRREPPPVKDPSRERLERLQELI